MSKPVESESVVDDLAELLRWRPVLPLLKAAREQLEPGAKLVALRDLSAFVLRQLWEGRDPYSSPAFATFALLVSKAGEDPQLLAAFARLLPKAPDSRSTRG